MQFGQKVQITLGKLDFLAFKNVLKNLTDHNHLNGSVFKATEYAERSKVKVYDWLVKYESNL